MSLERLKSKINETEYSTYLSPNGIDKSKESLSIFDENSADCEETTSIFETSDYSYNPYDNEDLSEEWIDLTTAPITTFGNGYELTTGKSEIYLKDYEDITVKYNEETGEIVIIGATADDINLGDGDNLTLINANANEITAKGNSIIKVQGANSNVFSITGGEGSQTVEISNGAKVEKIKTGKGDDTITVSDKSSVGNIEAGKGNDTVTIENSTVDGDIDLGDNNDILLIENSSVTGKIYAEGGEKTVNVVGSNLYENIYIDDGVNTLNLSATNVSGNIIADSGDVNITFEGGSTLSNGKIISARGNGSYNITVDGSNLDGEIIASNSAGGSWYKSFSLELDNSSIDNISGLRDDNSTTFISTNSRSFGAENVSNRTVTTISLDTSEGSEFEGFEKIEPDSKTEMNQSKYTLSDGTIILMDEIGEVYVNPETGAVVVNSAYNAKILGSNDDNNNLMTVINSSIVSHSNVSGSVEYRNSSIGSLTIEENEATSLIFSSDCKVEQINSDNSNLTIGISDTSKIENIIGEGEGTVSIIATGGEIGKITSKQAAIIVEDGTTNTTIGTIKTTKGSINVSALYSTISNIENDNEEGSTTLVLNNTTLETIDSKAVSDITLTDCNVTSEIQTSKKADTLVITDCNIKRIKTNDGEDIIHASGSSIESFVDYDLGEATFSKSDVESLTLGNGDIAVYNSDIGEMISEKSNTAILASEIDNLNVRSGNIDIKNSIIENHNLDTDENSIYIAHIDNFGSEEDINRFNKEEVNPAQSTLDELENEDIHELYLIIEQSEFFNNAVDELGIDVENLSEREIIEKLYENGKLDEISQFFIDEMNATVITLEKALEDDAKSMGIFGIISYSIDKNSFNNKKEFLQKAIENGDFFSIFDAYNLFTDEISAANAINEYNESLEYYNSLEEGEIIAILTVLGYIGNAMEYNITVEDGYIKESIARWNNNFGIGTTQNEAIAYVNTFNEDLAKLTEDYLNGNLSNSEFVVEYKRITGNSFTEKNIATLLDNNRENDTFENLAQDKIKAYQTTQETIFQVGEYVVVVAAGTLVTYATGGAAGPVVANTLASLGRMGVALTATTVSCVAKMAIELTERQTNGIIADDINIEDTAKTIALMYAGCLCGQFGNCVGDLFRDYLPEFFEQFMGTDEFTDIFSKMLAKSAEITADTGASVLTTMLITGNAEWDDECTQNLFSEFIGYINSKIAGAYFAQHPEITIKNELYNTRQNFGENADVVEVNKALLKQYGFSETEIEACAGYSSEAVDTLIYMKAIDMHEADSTKLQISSVEKELIHRSIDTSELNENQIKIAKDLYSNLDTISQETDSTCAIVSLLNGIESKPMLIQTIANKFDYDANTKTYRFTMYGDEFEVKINEGDNLFLKAYDAYQIEYGDKAVSVIDIFNEMLDGANDIVVRPNTDNINTLKTYCEDDYSILTFNTTEEFSGLSAKHSYTILKIDDDGTITLKDPATLEEITISKSEYENKDCQIEGKTYTDDGLVDTNLEAQIVAGKKHTDTHKDEINKIIENSGLEEEQINSINSSVSKLYGSQTDIITILSTIEAMNIKPEEFIELIQKNLATGENDYDIAIEKAIHIAEIYPHITQSEYFTPFKLSLDEVDRIYEALKIFDIEQVINILSENNLDMAAHCEDMFIQPSATKNLYDLISPKKSLIGIDSVNILDLGEINGSGKRILIPNCSTISKSNVQMNARDLIISNLMTTDAIDIAIKNEFLDLEETVDINIKGAQSIKTTYGDIISKIEENGFESLTTYESHALTKKMGNLYDDNTSFRNEVNKHINNTQTNSKYRYIYGCVEYLRNEANSSLDKYNMEITDHAIVHVK